MNSEITVQDGGKEPGFLKKHLSDQLQLYLDDSQKRISKNGIAQRTGLDRRTIDRILDGDSNLKRVDTWKLLKLYNLINPDMPNGVTYTELVAFCKNFASEVNTELVDSVYSKAQSTIYGEEDGGKSALETINRAIEFKVFSLMTAMSGNPPYLTRAQLNQYNGEEAIRAANNLVEKGLFSVQGRVYYLDSAINNKHINFSPEMISQFYPEIVKKFSLEHELWELQATAIAISEGLSLRGIKEVKKASAEWIEKIRLIKSKEENLGNYPYAAYLSSGPYVSDMEEFIKNGPQEGVLQ